MKGNLDDSEYINGTLDVYVDQMMDEGLHNTRCRYKIDVMPENKWYQGSTNDDVRIALNRDWQWAFTLRNGLCVTNAYRKAVEEFNEFVASLSSEFLELGDPVWWFRGQANVEWPLVPGVLREDFCQSTYQHVRMIFQDNDWYTPHQLYKERMMMSSFKREGTGILKEEHTDEEWYVIAQHHGLPTRLLDWSVSPQLALWMAVENITQSDKDGVIVAMVPILQKEKKPQVEFWDKEQKKRLFELLSSNPEGVTVPGEYHELFKHESVLLYSPNNFTSRQTHQLSRFTLHTPAPIDSKMVATVGVNDFYECKEFIVKAEYKEHYKSYLLASGMRRWNIYPDLDNLAKGIRDAHVVAPGNKVVIADRFN